MKAKVLHWKYNDGSDSGIERIYFERHFEQAEVDLKMLKSHSEKKWFLDYVNVHGGKEKNGRGRPLKNKSNNKKIKKQIVKHEHHSGIKALTVKNNPNELHKFKNIKELGDFLRGQRTKNNLSRKDVERNIGIADSMTEWLERAWVKNALKSGYRNRNKIIKLINYYENFDTNNKQTEYEKELIESINDDLKHRFSTIKELGRFLLKERMRSGLSTLDVVRKLKYKLNTGFIEKIERWRNKTTYISGVKDVNNKIFLLIDFYKKTNNGKLRKENKKTQIDFTGLSGRVKNRLKRANINTISQLVDRSEKELMSLKGFGYKCVCEVKDFLKENGYSDLKKYIEPKNIDGNILEYPIWKFNDELDFYSLGLLSQFTINTIGDLIGLSENDLQNCQFRYRERAIKTIKEFLNKYNLKLK